MVSERRRVRDNMLGRVIMHLKSKKYFLVEKKKKKRGCVSCKRKRCFKNFDRLFYLCVLSEFISFLGKEINSLKTQR